MDSKAAFEIGVASALLVNIPPAAQTVAASKAIRIVQYMIFLPVFPMHLGHVKST
jgi:hypothetical protein